MLTPEDQVRIELSTLLTSHIMGGLVARMPVAGTDQTGRIASCMREAERYVGAAMNMVRSLMAVNTQDYPAERGDERLKTVTSFMAAAVSGLVAQGQSPTDALNQINRQRQVFFDRGQTLLQRQEDAGPGQTEVTSLLMANVMGGMMARRAVAGADQSVRLLDSMREAGRYTTQYVSLARSLSAANDEAGPADPAEAASRLKAVSALAAAAVSGLIARGESPSEALTQIALQRRAFFLRADSLLRQQAETAERAQTAAAQPPEAVTVRRTVTIAEWRERRERAEQAANGLQLEPLPEAAGSRHKPR